MYRPLAGLGPEVLLPVPLAPTTCVTTGTGSVGDSDTNQQLATVGSGYARHSESGSLRLSGSAVRESQSGGS
jgi:hypothetical protein